MHMADALVNPAVGGTMYALSTVAAGYSVHRLKKEEDLNKKIPTMGVMGAVVFATQMMNFSIPGTGSSGHLCGGLLLTALLGPYAGFISMIGVLLIQCLFFADGGLLALGANVWNMAFYGCFFGAVIWKLMMRKGITKGKIVLASVLGSVVTLQFGALSVTVETLLSGITELPFLSFVTVMQPIHLAIGIVEGLITSAVLCFVYEARPELLWGQKTGVEQKQPRLSYQKTMVILMCLFLVTAGGLSFFASSHPDGLEWSIARLTGNTELNEGDGEVYQTTSRIQEKTAFLPDYQLKNSDSPAGGSFAGIVGCGITVAVLTGAGYSVKMLKKRKQ